MDTTRDWRWWSMCILALAGIGVAGYLTWAYVGHQAIMCGQSEGCDQVRDSVYSHVFGIPVSGLGLLAYLTLLGLVFLRARAPDTVVDYIPLALFGISLMGVLYSAYLTFLEVYVILAICRWCVASAVIMTAIFVLSLFDLGARDVS
jgi:uncharacterized membrane protein